MRFLHTVNEWLPDRVKWGIYWFNFERWSGSSIYWKGYRINSCRLYWNKFMWTPIIRITIKKVKP